MTTKRISGDEFSSRLGRAIAHGIVGDMIGAANEIQAVVASGPADTYGAICALAHIAVAPQLEGAEEGATFGPIAEHNGQLANVDDAPPALRFAMRFMAAQANGDYGTSVALFKVGMTKDPDALAEAVAILLEAAVKTERALIERRAGRADA